MPRPKSKNPLKKLTNTQLVAIIVAMITGGCTLVAACIGLGVPILTEYLPKQASPIPPSVSPTSPTSGQPLSDTTTIPTPFIFSTPHYVELPALTPAVAGEQLDFSPILIDITPEKIPDRLGFNETPYDGVYISQLWIPTAEEISWMVYYKDGTGIFAESETCTLIKDYPEKYQAPMNLKVSETTLPVTIYTATRYSLKITGAEILLSEYSPPKTDIDYLQPFTPGGGGAGPRWVEAPYAVFLPIETDRTLVKHTVTNYKVDFKWFELQAGQGVEINFPIKITEPGTYQFQVKIFVVGTNSLDNKPENIVLTTGRGSYSWAKIDDPRDYDVYRFRDEPPLKLELCP